MSALRQFLRIEAAAVLALLLVAATVAAAVSLLRANPFPEAILAMFVATALVGAPFAVLYGAPAYWLLMRHGHATLPFAVALGAVPGLGLLVVETTPGLFALGCGVVVAALTHARCRNLGLRRDLRRRPFQ